VYEATRGRKADRHSAKGGQRAGRATSAVIRVASLRLVSPVARSGDGLGPEVPFKWMDTLWVQVTGTLCNIACRHCFISCGPKATQIPMMSVEEVQRVLHQGRDVGMRHVYFTGGEPFLHPDIQTLVDLALEVAALTVVTNGILLDRSMVGWLTERFERSRNSLDVRVSLDGMTAAQNDPVRGRGTFQSIVDALRLLGEAGLSPVVTVVEHEEGLEGSDARSAFLDFVAGLGIRQPRVKFLPLLRIGREERRTHSYLAGLGEEPLLPAVESSLLCATGRCATAHGVYTCPILVEESAARLGASVADTMRPIRLGWTACQTCVLDGLRCNT
jgi:sulfatase maturation enzyme AslB (radical SAM superfamily)